MMTNQEKLAIEQARRTNLMQQRTSAAMTGERERVASLDVEIERSQAMIDDLQEKIDAEG
jgi:hypothetical protein